LLSLCYYFLDCPTSEGRLLSVRARLLRVTQNGAGTAENPELWKSGKCVRIILGKTA